MTLSGWIILSLHLRSDINLSKTENIYLLLKISHLHHLDLVGVPGVVPDLHAHVGVEGEHDAEWDHKENFSEVGFFSLFLTIQ